MFSSFSAICGCQKKKTSRLRPYLRLRNVFLFYFLLYFSSQYLQRYTSLRGSVRMKT